MVATQDRAQDEAKYLFPCRRDVTRLSVTSQEERCM
jgi:hypothetical protein